MPADPSGIEPSSLNEKESKERKGTDSKMILHVIIPSSSSLFCYQSLLSHQMFIKFCCKIIYSNNKSILR